MPTQYDVAVIGAGNAGMCAALAAREVGARVLLVDKADADWEGGNSYFTAGAFRLTYSSLADLQALVAARTTEWRDIHLEPYSMRNFVDDFERVSNRRNDHELTEIVAREATAAAHWLAGHGVGWSLLFERQSFPLESGIRFWGNLPLGVTGGGPGLVAAERRAVDRLGVAVLAGTELTDMTLRESKVDLELLQAGRRFSVGAQAVVLAAGGFEASASRRVEYLGPLWHGVKVRGTPCNTGEALELAVSLGAARHGDWASCHSIPWDADAGEFGDRIVNNRLSRQGYPFGIMLNRDCERFVDEGADFRNYTYAKYGAEILRQPGGVAYQVFDSKGHELVNESDYSSATTSRAVAHSIPELASLTGTPRSRLVEAIEQFNASVRPGHFNPAIRDGNSTTGLKPPKSNWALPLSEPPFYAYAVKCGITFTFGGLQVGPAAQVLDSSGRPVPRLFAAGEIVGGLFHGNYPGGAGLTAGAVLGRRAGTAAARIAAS